MQSDQKRRMIESRTRWIALAEQMSRALVELNTEREALLLEYEKVRETLNQTVRERDDAKRLNVQYLGIIQAAIEQLADCDDEGEVGRWLCEQIGQQYNGPEEGEEVSDDE